MLTCGEEVNIRRCTWLSTFAHTLEAALTFGLRLLWRHLKASHPQGEAARPEGRQSRQTSTYGRTHDSRNSRIHDRFSSDCPWVERDIAMLTGPVEPV